MKLSAILLLSAVAQSDEPTRLKDFVSEQENEVVQKRNNEESLSFFRKLEDLVGKLFEDVSRMEAKLEALISQAQRASSHKPPEPAAALQPVAAPAQPAVPEPTSVMQATANVDAERVANDSFALVSGDEPGDAEAVPMPFLNGSTPDWVKNGLRNAPPDAAEYSFAISSSLLPDIEQCNEDLKLRMMSEIRVFLKKNVLTYENAKLPELTKEYVDKYWVKRGQFFDNVQDRPSGSYHQVWVGLHISTEQLAKIRQWEKQSERDQRIRKAGVLGGISIFAIAMLSGAVGLLARREKAKLRG